MKQLIWTAGLAALLTACGNRDGSGNAAGDTASHSSHTTTEADGAAAGGNSMKAMHDAMNNMMQQMQSMQPTGDVDYDFAMMMKHHHQGAIDMAKAEVAGGTDSSMKAMAQKMITDQQKDMDELNAYMQNNPPATKGSDYAQKAMAVMTPMSEMKMESGSLDAMFASMMIPHHEDGFEMAQQYRDAGKKPELKRMASKIITTHPAEIQEMKGWLEKNRQ